MALALMRLTALRYTQVPFPASFIEAVIFYDTMYPLCLCACGAQSFLGLFPLPRFPPFAFFPYIRTEKNVCEASANGRITRVSFMRLLPYPLCVGQSLGMSRLVHL